jgi:hypothetical protein
LEGQRDFGMEGDEEKKHKSAESFINKLELKIVQAENSSFESCFYFGKKSKTFLAFFLLII